MDFIKMIMELPGEKRSQDVVEHTEWNSLWKLIVTQGNHSENYLEQLYDYFFNKEGWVHKVQAELDGVQPYVKDVMTQPVGKAPDGSLWTYPSTESGTVPWGNVMGDITKQQDLIQRLDAKANAEHRHGINTLIFNEGDINSSWIRYSSQSVPTSALNDLSVTTEKLNNGAVTSAKIASGAVINDSIANYSISGVKIANGSVTREKLAQDALYSPVVRAINGEVINADHIGKTLMLNTASDFNIWFTAESLNSLPQGAEIAFFRWMDRKCTITFSGDMTVFANSEPYFPTVPISFTTGNYTTFAIKKLTNTGIVIIGDVEVVT